VVVDQRTRSQVHASYVSGVNLWSPAYCKFHYDIIYDTAYSHNHMQPMDIGQGQTHLFEKKSWQVTVLQVDPRAEYLYGQTPTGTFFFGWDPASRIFFLADFRRRKFSADFRLGIRL